MYIQYIYISQLLYALYFPVPSILVQCSFFFFQILYLYLSSKSDILCIFFLYIYSIKTSNFRVGHNSPETQNTEF